ncbi:MAG: phosphonate ABC transporter, permease protein PhnE [Bradyrhizobiaceae bacterium]|nr:phosphonate ABC transporter, permease protein PhnE [Hyphomicrobiales bacterium]MBV9428721.1 phosphonate ABC transporter, permease protein PhnE [Bradyrhizobiaceae bacterium]
MTPNRTFLPSTPEVLARYPALAAAARRNQVWAAAWLIAALALTVFSFWSLGIAFGQIRSGLSQLGWLVAQMFPPSTGSHFPLLLHAMGETLAIAFLGTLIAATMAFPVSFLAARNTTPGTVIHFLARRCFDTIRGVDVLIWALVFVGVVGLGPFAGILAIAVSDAGTFGKLFSETLETTDRKPIDGVLSTGGSQLLAIRFALIPQVLPVMLSQLLYYFESNVRNATIIGIVGAGGIGLQLSEQIRTYDFDQVAFVIIMILVTVAAIDWVCGKLRFHVIGRST